MDDSRRWRESGGRHRWSQNLRVARWFPWMLALYGILVGPGCDACAGCARAMNSDPPSRQAERWREMYRTPEVLAALTREAHARQAAADRYRDQIVPGMGCDTCPSRCTLVDLRPLPHEEYARQFRELVLEHRHTNILEDTPETVIEYDRLICIVRSHESMLGALIKLLGPDEHPRVRLEAAVLSIGFDLPVGDAEGVILDLAEGSDLSSRLARGLIAVWDEEGWPPEPPYIEDDAGVAGDGDGTGPGQDSGASQGDTESTGGDER